MFKQSIGIDKNFENKQSREQSLLSPGEGGGGRGEGPQEFLNDQMVFMET